MTNITFGGFAMAKKLSVTIELEMTVPDDWQIIETTDGIGVLKIAPDQFLDLTFEPMITSDVEGSWTNAVSEDFMEDLMDMVESESVAYELKQTLN
ncbi:hypothetical protein [Fluviibacter phosphoraccumulans]|jgi:hypothetical protein